MNDHLTPVRRALLSVSDKNGIVDFARSLHELGVELLSTGGTHRLLSDSGLPVTEIAEYTGFPEMMAGRVKTLHPKVHGGLLGRRGIDDAVMAEQGIKPIDLLVLNLYPFEQVASNPDATFDSLIENIDIGGPAMLRAAAKNFKDVAVVTETEQYSSVLMELTKHEGQLSAKTRYALAVAAFNSVARYDASISNTLSAITEPNDKGAAERSIFPQQANSSVVKVMDLRYGENPHQQAAFYRELHPAAGALATFTQLQGKALSFNNIADSDAAWECVRYFQEPACVIVKHANPCGVALAAEPKAAYEAAYRCDPTSAFGGIIAFNTSVDGATAEAILERQFVEVLIAPDYSQEALAHARKKPNIRLLRIPSGKGRLGMDCKRVGAGLLLQSPDDHVMQRGDLKVVTRQAPTEKQLDDLMFAWQVANYVKSNAIVYARDQATIGIGAGQMSRVYSARIAGIKAADEGLAIAGSVMASDAFFPFRDGIDAAAQAGISAVIQPGGSQRDDEVIAAADEHGMAMVFTAIRHFRH